MGKPVNRVLFVNSEIMPFLPETPLSRIGRCLPQGIQERKKEIRAFMPRYGCINERKNQLHEVIRLSGMNIIIGDVDRPLVIKVASITSARIQVYFIDNEDYFRRKQISYDTDGKFFEDNGQRAIFFARGVLETVKKLRWAPDVIHCQGWISHLVPLYLKKAYNGDPIFSGSRIVTSLYNEAAEEKLSPSLKDNVLFGGTDWHKSCENSSLVFGRHNLRRQGCRPGTCQVLRGEEHADPSFQRGLDQQRSLHRGIRWFLSTIVANEKAHGSSHNSDSRPCVLRRNRREPWR